jgi:hypothetical protein
VFFLFALPVGWAALSLLHFHFPGDEHGLWAVSSMAGTWITFLLPSVGDIHQPWIRFSVAATGALVMAGAGWLLYRSGARRWLWTAVWLLAAMIILVITLQSYPSLNLAMRKNGSWTAYILSSLLLGMYAATVISYLLAPFLRRWKHRRRPHSPPDPARRSRLEVCPPEIVSG